jgi:hypothetical protein
MRGMPENTEGVTQNKGQPISVPPIPRLTRTEKSVWATFVLVAILVVALPIISHRFTLADAGAVVLLLGAVAISYIWYRSGELRTAEWLTEPEYEGFLKELQQPPRSHPGPGPD